MKHNGEEVYGVIYTITHLASGKKYVGQSTDIEKRWASYRRLDFKAQPKLYNAVLKHGLDAFAFVVVAVAYDKAQLDCLEVRHIEEWRTACEGYNCQGGGSNGKHSVESRAKMSALKLGIPKSLEHCAKIAAAHRGKMVSSETRARMRLAHRKRCENPEANANLRAAHKQWCRRRKLAPPTKIKTLLNQESNRGAKTMNEQEKRKPGRPRKERNLIFYRSGNRIKAWNAAIGANVNVTEKDLRGNVVIFDGLGFDYVNWCRNQTREGFYNAATRTPFRQLDVPIEQTELDRLEEDYRNNATLRRVMDACSCLFDGGHADEPVILGGTFWMRMLGNLFIREAGADGISRSRFERPAGKIWASVNVLSSQGPGYNYTLEAWNSVKNMMFPPVFCVRMDGSDAPDAKDTGEPEMWTPRELAAAILHGLWRTKAVDSCAALSPSPESAPLAAAPASDDPAPCAGEGAGTPPVSGDPDAVSAEEPRDEADAVPAPLVAGKTWGEIKAGEVWLKGLTTAKDLQAPAPLSRVLDTVVSHAVTKTLTDACRATADKKARNEYKRDNLHVWYPAPVYADRFKGAVKENVVGYTGLACLDFDGMESFEAAENARDDLFMEFREVLFSAVSASGLGVYVLVALDFDGTEAGYRTALSAAFETFEAKGYMPDTGCVDPTRARYMSSDPDALSRPDAYVPPAIKAGGPGEGYFILPASMLRSCWTNSGRKRKGAGKEYLKEALDRIANAPEGMKDTTITSVMGTAARLIRNYGLNADEVYDRVRTQAAAYGYDTKKTDDKIRRLGVANGEGTK